MAQEIKAKEERKTATFSEHWRFFSVPFLITTTALPVLFMLATWPFCRSEKYFMLLTLISAALSLFLVVFYFEKRIKLLVIQVPIYHRRFRPSEVICFFTHTLLLIIPPIIIHNYLTKGFIESDLPLFPHQVSEDGDDLVLCFLLVLFTGNLLWWIVTSIPVMYREDLYRFQNKQK